MQIVSGNALDLRVAVYHFTHPNSPHQFITFPMIHVGEPTFYQEITRRVAQCDIVLYEGISSKKGTLAIKAYESMANHLGLSLQREEMKSQDLAHVELIHADLSKQEFEGYWRKIPFYKRIFYNTLTLGSYLYAMARVDRHMLQKEFTLNLRDEPTWLIGENSEWDNLISKRRDQRLIHHIERQMKIHEGVPKVFGVLYGAAHVQTIMQYLLDQQRFVVKDAEWVIAFRE